MKRYVVHILALTSIILFFLQGSSLNSDTYDYGRFSHLPIMEGGREKPVDTLARNLLMVLSGKTSVTLKDDSKIEANQWLLDMATGREGAVDYRFIRITNKDLLTSLELDPRKGSYRYSYAEVMPKLPQLQSAIQSASQKDKRDRDLYDREAIKLANRITLFQIVLTSFEDPRIFPADQLLPAVQRYMQLEDQSAPLVIPPTKDTNQWRPLMSTLVAGHPAMSDVVKENNLEVSPLALRWGAMLMAYSLEDEASFNDALTGYEIALQREASISLSKMNFEVLFNRINPFVKLAWVYVIVFMLSCVGWLIRKGSLIQYARVIMLYTAVFHTLALIARIFLSGYPPVTNLYSSAIFIGWGAVLLGLLLERTSVQKELGAGLLVGSVVGALTLLIAYFLSGDGDTLHQLQAVLDTRFWLSTHVVTITLGYTATFIAGIAGIFYIIIGLFTNRMDETASKELNRILYAVTCFALLLSFVGTVLGGLWADDSWGRFWGWDPKENGALLIVTWCAIMLHARWGRMVTTKGFAVMAVFGNIVTAWSWFGVNQLGIGLHSYGFTDSAGKWLLIFCFSQLLICLLGILPQRSGKNF